MDETDLIATKEQGVMRLCIHGGITGKEKKKTALKWKLKMRKFFNVIILSSLALYIN